jgi:asparagine synthase (glutamine-hydrolysing)
MCGFAGFLGSSSGRFDPLSILQSMTKVIGHRGKDGHKEYLSDVYNVIFNRLSIIDVNAQMQPFFSKDEEVVLVCNGEIYNYLDLKKQFPRYDFKTKTDTEVLLPLYLEFGIQFLDYLDGQFAIAMYDRRSEELILVRDHFGVCPLFYTKTKDQIVFGSEVKAILEHPDVDPIINLKGLDQVITFPGVVSPSSMFKGVNSIPPASYAIIKDNKVVLKEYWSLEFPKDPSVYFKIEDEIIDRSKELLETSVLKRMQSDVDIGAYVSGGLDSSIIATLMKNNSKEFKMFSIGFESRDHDESHFQQLLANCLESTLVTKQIREDLLLDNLKKAVYHCEVALKESYNVCSLFLSELAANNNTRVVLAGEGADEFFGGYIGYRFDKLGRGRSFNSSLDESFEKEMRETLWGDDLCIYEKNYYEHSEFRQQLYTEDLSLQFDQFSSTSESLFLKTNLQGIDPLHKRSWLDYKLRLADHLVSDHGDRMGMANTVEVRYPFLDKNLIEFASKIHPDFLLKNNTEKYILKSMNLAPPEITNREKYGFHAQGTPQLLQQKCSWVNDYLSYDYIAMRGVFSPDSIEYLKEQYSTPGFKLNIPHEDDVLMCVLTFNILSELYGMKL